ncbi:lytic transglycosylase domain-containing protein, partial [Acidithiobacillus ferrooxidans]|nr:lytic transglycosylase domain-containing protein [Acidithiobacillus ferrooxidans]
MAAFKAILRVRSSRPAAVLVSLVLWMGCGTSVATAGILSAAQEQLLNSAATAFAQGDYRPAADALPELENTYMGP